jgi:putative heme transporter
VTARRHAQHPGGEPVNAGKSTMATAKAAAIDAAQAHPLTRKTLVKRALAIAVAGAGIYLVLPKLAAVLGAWPRLSTLNPIWFTLCMAAELASFTCNFALQRLALRTKNWFPVVTAGLTGNSVTNSLPGGDAAGAAVQFKMLTTAGFDTDTAVGGLTAFSLLEVGGLLALPIFALPAMLAGVPVSRGLVHTALLGIAAFVLYAIFGVIVLRTDWPLATLGRAAQSLWNRITRGHRQPVTGLDERLLAERDAIRAVLGKNWRQAVLLTVGRLGFDYGCLLAALRATGASPQPSLVLLAYSAAGIVALFPLTPGGLGIVEASLSGLLILAGVRAGYAFLATLAYRIASYWLPLISGLPAYLLFRHRYGRPVARRAASGEADSTA